MRGVGQGRACLLQGLLAPIVGQEAEVADLGETRWEDVQGEATEELDARKSQLLHPAIFAVVLGPEADGVVVDLEKARVSNGDAMGVAAQIVEECLRPSDRAFGKDHPAGLAELVKHLSPICGLAPGLDFSVELEFILGSELAEAIDELGSPNLGHGVNAEEESIILGTVPRTLGGESPTGDQAVEVGMIHKVLSPGVKQGGDANLSVEGLPATA